MPVNLHIHIPHEHYETLKREGLINPDNQLDIKRVWLRGTSLDEIDFTMADATSTQPYMHILTLWGKITRKDTKRTPM